MPRTQTRDSLFTKRRDGMSFPQTFRSRIRGYGTAHVKLESANQFLLYQKPRSFTEIETTGQIVNVLGASRFSENTIARAIELKLRHRCVNFFEPFVLAFVFDRNSVVDLAAWGRSRQSTNPSD